MGADMTMWNAWLASDINHPVPIQYSGMSVLKADFSRSICRSSIAVGHPHSPGSRQGLQPVTDWPLGRKIWVAMNLVVDGKNRRISDDENLQTAETCSAR